MQTSSYKPIMQTPQDLTGGKLPSQDSNPGRSASESLFASIRLGQSSVFVFLWGLLNDRSWDYLICSVCLSVWDFWVDRQSPSLVILGL